MISEIELTIILRAFVAALLGFIIGWQRESTGAAAGDRTFALMSLGVASLIAYVSLVFPVETARFIAGLLTGIGFIGGGMIMRVQTGRIRGLTTAASLWASTSIGVLVGTGHYFIGVALMLLVLFILAWERLPLLSNIRGPRVHATHTHADPPPPSGEDPAHG
jgi:putative Mg2+ transporter-C (MgtC) family protein